MEYKINLSDLFNASDLPNWVSDINGLVYSITNLVTGFRYVGFTKNSIERRFIKCQKSHKRCHELMKSGFWKSPNQLHIDMEELGLDKFEVEILGEYDEAKLPEMEVFFINKYRTYIGFPPDCKGYNKTLGGERWIQSRFRRGLEKLNESKDLFVISYVSLLTSIKTLKSMGCSKLDLDLYRKYNFIGSPKLTHMLDRVRFLDKCKFYGFDHIPEYNEIKEFIDPDNEVNLSNNMYNKFIDKYNLLIDSLKIIESNGFTKLNSTIYKKYRLPGSPSLDPKSRDKLFHRCDLLKLDTSYIRSFFS